MQEILQVGLPGHKHYWVHSFAKFLGLPPYSILDLESNCVPPFFIVAGPQATSPSSLSRRCAPSPSSSPSCGPLPFSPSSPARAAPRLPLVTSLEGRWQHPREHLRGSGSSSRGKVAAPERVSPRKYKVARSISEWLRPAGAEFSSGFVST